MRDIESIWEESVSTETGDLLWYEFLLDLEVRDLVKFSFEKAVLAGETGATLADAVRMYLPNGSAPAYEALPPAMRNFARSLEAIQSRMRRLLVAAMESTYPPPTEGVAQYFADDLSFCLYFTYQLRKAVHIRSGLVVGDPVLASDPTELLNSVRTIQELDLARRATYANRKIIIIGNVLAQVDRWTAPSVFGPSIDTLIATDWLLTNRFLAARLDHTNAPFFEDPIPKEAMAALRNGPRVLEIGSGSGLILASFARNEPRLAALDAIDVNVDAVATTYKNCLEQRQIQHGDIGDIGTYTIGRFSPVDVNTPYDLVLCNPPYVPSDTTAEGRHATATMGTELLETVLGNLNRLIGEAGELYLLISHLAKGKFKSALPADYVEELLGERTVPFIVEAADLEDKDRLKHLLRLKLKTKRVKGVPRYYHDVLFYRVKQRRTHG